MSTNRNIIVEEAYCGTCIHYHQHYVLGFGMRFTPLWHGHCGTPRRQRRKPDEICPYWESNQKPPKSTKPD